MKRLFDKKTIYSRTINVPVWSFAKGSFALPITTLIIETTFFGWKFHRIKCHYTLLQNAYYDGEHSSNTYLRTMVNVEYQKAKVWLACEYNRPKQCENV